MWACPSILGGRQRWSSLFISLANPDTCEERTKIGRGGQKGTISNRAEMPAQSFACEVCEMQHTVGGLPACSCSGACFHANTWVCVKIGEPRIRLISSLLPIKTKKQVSQEKKQPHTLKWENIISRYESSRALPRKKPRMQGIKLSRLDRIKKQKANLLEA